MLACAVVLLFLTPASALAAEHTAPEPDAVAAVEFDHHHAALLCELNDAEEEIDERHAFAHGYAAATASSCDAGDARSAVPAVLAQSHAAARLEGVTGLPCGPPARA